MAAAGDEGGARSLSVALGGGLPRGVGGGGGLGGGGLGGVGGGGGEGGSEGGGGGGGGGDGGGGLGMQSRHASVALNCST